MNDLYSSQYDPMINVRILGQTAMPSVPIMGMPYASMLGTPDLFAEEKQVFEDARRLQAFYPRIAQEIQQHVEEACDKLEYEGSMMFDEYPDRVLLWRLTEKITDEMKDFSVEEESQLLSEQSGNRRRRREDDWLGDLVQVMLLDEMHRRRCRHRRCQKRRFW